MSFIGWDQRQQFGQHWRFAHAVVRHLNGLNRQRLAVNAQVHLAFLTPVLGPVLLALPFTLTQELDFRAVHQQVQRGGACPVGQFHLPGLLAQAHGAQVGHAPVQARQTQQGLNQGQALTKRLVKQALDAQTKLKAASERIHWRARLPLGMAYRCISLSSQIVSDPGL